MTLNFFLQILLKAGLLTEREKKKLEKLSCAEEENRQVLQPQHQPNNIGLDTYQFVGNNKLL